MIGYCKVKKIPIIDYNLLCLRLDFNITLETMLLLGRQFEESVESVYPFEESEDSFGTPEKRLLADMDSLLQYSHLKI